jgi:putative DNA modification/repair radical SAM protein
MHFYRRNYIEGLFLSSGVLKDPDHTTERMIETLRILREEYKFYGYIHSKAIPGTSDALLYQLGLLTDRMSVNIELPSQQSLALLAPDKSKQSILSPMGLIANGLTENKKELVRYKGAPRFVPAGHSTQMIVGASPETDYQILHLSEALYKKYGLKRVFYSAYMPVSDNSNLPALGTKPPLLREHRLYQADWLLRFYHFSAAELLDEAHQNFNPYIDPKCNWAINNMGIFPVEINKAPIETLLRVPGIGVRSAQRIVYARRASALTFDGLKKLGIVMKRARYFITCNGKLSRGVSTKHEDVLCALMSKKALEMYKADGYYTGPTQLSFFNSPDFLEEEQVKCLHGEM